MRKFLLLLLLPLFLTGCSHGLVHDKAYLRAAAVDSRSVTLSFFSAADDSPRTVTIPVSSPSEAKSLAELRLGQEIFTGFTELILLEDCPSADTLAFMLTDWRVSPSCLTAAGPGAVLRSADTESLEGSVRRAQAQGLAPECDIVTVLGDLLSPEKTALAPELSPDGVSGTAILS